MRDSESGDALSLELYFKYLIFAKNNDLNELKKLGHKIDVLFDKVPADWKNSILDNITSTMPESDFIETLKDFSEAFEIWRYVYEYNRVTTTTRLHQIADLLSEECRKINDNISV